MRTALKIIALGLAALLVLAGGFLAYVAVRGIPKYEPGKVQLKVELTPERVARGRKFVTLLCAECHMDPTTRQLTGKHMADAPAEFGPIFSRNITRDRKHGIGGWSDGELAYLLRTGVARDGQYIPPYMAKLPHLADEDLHSIIAFLRSDDPLVAAAAKDPPGVTQPSFLTKLLSNVAFKPLPYPHEAIPRPNESDELSLGRYFVINLDCWTCHSPDFKTMNTLEPEKTPGFLSGGNPMLDLSQRVVPTANITFDEETGIGRWSKADFIRAMRDGVRPDGRPILYPMGVMPELSDSELSAMYAYLASAPKIRNAVPRAKPPAPAGGDRGKQLYYRYGCYGCHGDNGIGIADLRKTNEHYPSDEALIAWIKNAPAIKPGTRMPKWEGIIKEEELPPLAAYVRTLGAKE
jgi:mono/diheme cytochrome c family protein